MEHNSGDNMHPEIIQYQDELAFSLKKINASEKLPLLTTVRFPYIEKSTEDCDVRDNDDEIVVSRSTPAFNNDNCFYTPAFVLDADIEKVQKSLKAYQAHHIKRVEEVKEEKDQIFEPRPSINHTYCGICRTRYEEYKEHITGAVHSDKIKKAKFEQNIDKFMKILQKKNKRIVKQKKPALAPARRGRPPKNKPQKPQQIVQNVGMTLQRFISTQPSQQIQSNESPQTVKRQLETITPQNNNLSSVGQYLA